MSNMDYKEDYQHFMELLKKRHTARRFKPDPIPNGSIEKIIEAARWAMSGSNAQPWDFIIVKDRAMIKSLYEVYQEKISTYNFWLEQTRQPEFRHPAFQMEGEPGKQLDKIGQRPGWSEAPALIVVVGDGRRQFLSACGSHIPGRGLTQFTDGLANVCQIVHLAAASLGLASQWVTIHIKEPFKKILNVPEILTLYSVIPVGYPVKKLTGSFRRKVRDMVHFETYDQTKHMSDEAFIDYFRKLRGYSRRPYARSRGESDKEN
jgi:nitroreductase